MRPPEGTTHLMRTAWDTTYLQLNLSEAAANIKYWADGEWISSPYQTADARHRAHTAARLLGDWWHGQADWWGDMPMEDRDAAISITTTGVGE